MKTDTLRFRDLLQRDIRLVVPLFQRPYVWKQEDQWEPLWDDIRGIAEDLLNERLRRPHFLGAIVLEQVRTGSGEVEQRLVIDGQQRLTTAQIILEAFHDLCGELGATNVRNALTKMTRIDDPMIESGSGLFKVWPTTDDREAFHLVMDAGSANEVESSLKGNPALAKKPIVRGYLYYFEAIREWVSAESEKQQRRIAALLNALRDHMRFVVIDLEDEDDAQLIFETLNARGTPLLPSDLVKNFVFYRARIEGQKLEPLYEKYWQVFREWDDWWRESMGRGHAQRPRIDFFLQAFLTMRTREEVPVTHVYTVCRDYILQSKSTANQFLGDLSSIARMFGEFYDLQHTTPEGRFFQTMDVLGVTSLMPVVLELFSRFTGETKALRPILRDLESFLIRRTICNLNTRGYNRLFLDLLNAVSPDGDPATEVRAFLLKGDADSNRWPDDKEFRKAWVTAPIYRTLVRKRVRFLLETLEFALHDSRTEEIVTKLQIEHLLPQEWKTNWPLSCEGDPEDEAAERNTLLHTIGNLTLVTSTLNPTLSNGAWDKKRGAIRKYGALCLNRDVAEEEEWGESQIRARAKKLFKTARKIWPHPGRPGMTDTGTLQ